MKTAELAEYRQALQQWSRRLVGDVSTLKGEFAGSVDADLDLPTEPGERANLKSEQDVTVTVLDNEKLLLSEVNDALQRLDAGTFGDCAGCGKAITALRLRALPYTRFCITCADRPDRAVLA